MSRLTRKTLILAKTEVTEGTDSVPTGAANALLVSEPTIEYTYNNVDRDNLRSFIGANEQLPGTRYVTLSFSVELASSGAAGTAPAFGPLLMASAMAEVVTAGNRVEYNPVTTSNSVTIYYFNDGALKKALGSKGTVTLTAEEGSIPKLNFAFTGIDGGVTAVANPSPTLTAWKTPLVVTTTNSGQVTLGGTYSAGAITGGTPFCSRGLTIDAGNDVQYQAMLGPCTGVDIVNRDMTGSVQFDLTAAEEVTAFTAINAATLTSLSWVHGSAAGSKVTVFAPKVQRINPSMQDFNGRLLMGNDLRFTPNIGNDELTLCFH
jgi:hypothetical protein